MSFVSKGEKKMRNEARAAGKGADRSLPGDSFGKKGDGYRSGANHNVAPGSKDKMKHPVSEDADSGEYDSGETEKGSGYDPASGKRAKSVADLREALKKLNERASMDDESSPTGSEDGQDAKHTSLSKNESGYMKAGTSEMDRKSMRGPRGEADQEEDADEMVDPLDEDEEDSGQYKEGMTPQGKSRSKSPGLKKMRVAKKRHATPME